MSTQKPAAVFDLELKCDVQALSESIDKVRRFLGRHGVPPKAVYTADLVLEEVAVNIIQYAQAHGTIAVRVRVEADGVRLTIRDNGIPFDPTRVAAPGIPDSVAEADVGGLGIHMIRSLVDHMAYRREGGENHLDVRILQAEAGVKADAVIGPTKNEQG